MMIKKAIVLAATIFISGCGILKSQPAPDLNATATAFAVETAYAAVSRYLTQTAEAYSETPQPTGTPTNTPTPTPTITPTYTLTPTPTPVVYKDVPATAQEKVRWAVENGYIETDEAILGAEEEVELWEMYLSVYDLLFPEQRAPSAIGRFTDLDPKDTDLDPKLRNGLPKFEDLLRRGLIKPIYSSGDRFELCPYCNSRYVIAEAFIYAGGWEIPELSESPFPGDVSIHDRFAPALAVFKDLGFYDPGSSWSKEFRSDKPTDKLTFVIWLYRFNELYTQGEIPFTGKNLE